MWYGPYRWAIQVLVVLLCIILFMATGAVTCRMIQHEDAIQEMK